LSKREVDDLKRLLEETRRRREAAIGFDAYLHFWRKEKRLERAVKELEKEVLGKEDL